ncbi:C-GCAxxG-C-C family (seleno)protein [Chloroflexota bacterium]
MLQHYFEFITDDTVVSAVSLAGGGAGALIGSCGTFSAGLMALSTRFCPHSEELTDEEVTEFENARSRFYEFRDWFITEFSGVSCSDVRQKLAERSYNLRSDKERDEFHNLLITEFNVSYSDVLQKLTECSYNLRSDKERDEFRKLQNTLGFNCREVIEKVAVRIAEMLTRDA